MVTSMGINILSYLLVFRLSEFPIMLLKAIHLQVNIRFSLLKHQLKHKVAQLSNLY